MAMVNKPQDFFGFFSFKNPYGYAFYRPLTTQVFYFISRSLFGLQSFFFHLIAFVFFLANLILVFKIIEKLAKDSRLGFLAAFLYAINASNLGSLAYLGAFQEVGMAFFFFLTFWLYLKEKRLAFLTFIFALLSRENAIVLPLILIFYEFLLGKKKWRRTVPFWLILAIYAILRLGSGLPNVSIYQPVFDPRKIINGYFWYFVWGLGLPEMLVDFFGPGLKIDPRFILWYRREAQITFGASLLFFILLAIGILKSVKKDKSKEAFFIFWFLVGLLPVVFWPWHKFSYYLTVPLLGLVSFFILLLKNLPKAFFYFGVLALVVISLVTIKLSWKTYWVVNRAKISQNLVSDLKNKYSQLPKGASLYFQNDPDYPKIFGFGNSSTQAYYALSGENGPQVIYNDFDLQVYYEDLEKPPEGEEVFSLVAKIKQR